MTDNKGRGVFTGVDIHPGDVIEICPVILLPESQLPLLDKTNIHDYYFLWDENGDACLPLGYGLLYNHSFDANAEAVNLLSEDELKISCIKEIKAGDEITIQYQEVKHKAQLWFDPI